MRSWSSIGIICSNQQHVQMLWLLLYRHKQALLSPRQLDQANVYPKCLLQGPLAASASSLTTDAAATGDAAAADRGSVRMNMDQGHELAAVPGGALVTRAQQVHKNAGKRGSAVSASWQVQSPCRAPPPPAKCHSALHTPMITRTDQGRLGPAPLAALSQATSVLPAKPCHCRAANTQSLACVSLLYRHPDWPGWHCPRWIVGL
jgi:hypothetical protein